MGTIVKGVKNNTPDNLRLHLKGASEIVLKACDKFHNWETNQVVPLTEELMKKCNDTIDEFAEDALRTLTIAYKEINGDEDITTKDDKQIFEIEKSGFTLLGVFGIKDILRKGVKKAVRQCYTAGIKVRMVTGDNLKTALAIAKNCGIVKDHEKPGWKAEEHVMLGKDFME